MAVQSTVKLFLKARHIEVPDEWITACVEWIQSENPGLNISSSKILSEKVYEQWLYCDLTELATSCLPFGLPQKRSGTISGHFAVQVNQVRDVGHPAYAQLQKVQGADNANAAVSAEHPQQPAWEPKTSRMLLMQMTDGTSIVQGMEYRIIPSLNINLKPGTKVLLSGTICTRHGILLLTQEHVTILGGEIESLLVPNAMENILARHLGTEETEQPRQCEDTAPTQETPSQISQYYPSQISSTSNRSKDSQPQRRGRAQPLSGARIQTSTSGPSSNNFDDLGDDDFLDSDFEAALNQIESQASSSAKVNSSSSLAPCSKSSNFFSHTNNAFPESSKSGVGNRYMNELNKRNLRLNATKSNTNMMDEMDDEMNIDNDFFGDDFDDEILLSAEGQVDESSSCSQASTSAKISSQLTSRDPGVSSKSYKLSGDFSSLPQTSESYQSVSKQNASCIKTPKLVCSNTQLAANRLKQSTVQHNTSKAHAGQSSLKSFFSKSSQSLGGKRLTNSKNLKSNKLDMDDFKEDFLPKTDCPVSPNSFNMETSRIGKTSPLDSKLKLTSRISDFKQPATPVSKEMSMQYTTRKTSSAEERAKQMPPFTYLFFLPERPSVTQEFVVKGFIMTLVSRLEQSGGQWKLTVLINDGTASREVDIDDLVLQELIGMSAEQMNQRKIEAKSNPVLRSQLAKNVGGCQQKLISLCSLLHLQVSPDFGKPKLTSISSVTITTAEQLNQRLCADS